MDSFSGRVSAGHGAGEPLRSRTSTVTAAASAAPATSDETPATSYDVFISYRHGARDTAFARELLVLARGRCLHGAIDRPGLPGERQASSRKWNGVSGRAASPVAVISARYFDSDNTQEEAIISKVLDLSERKRRLIPLIIEPVAMPAWLDGIVGIDFTRPTP